MVVLSAETDFVGDFKRETSHLHFLFIHYKALVIKVVHNWTIPEPSRHEQQPSHGGDENRPVVDTLNTC